MLFITHQITDLESLIGFGYCEFEGSLSETTFTVPFACNSLDIPGSAGLIIPDFSYYWLNKKCDEIYEVYEKANGLLAK